MSKSVVYALKSVQINQKQRYLAMTSRSLRHRLPQAILQQRPIGQFCEWIVICEVARLREFL